jgi:putative glutamine amidotransferase
MNKSKPTIGVTLDQEPGNADKYSAFPWYALRQNYGDSIAASGGIPLMLPHHAEGVENYISRIDALLVTGGHFDVDPSLFGVTEKHSKTTTKPRRTEFEWAIMKAALNKRIPILGICGGEQLLNVVLGGTLIQHIPDSIPNCLEHEQKTPRDQTSHAVKIKEGTLLHRITGRTDIMVNSSHHQAVDKAGNGVVINAHSPDGVVEGIEYTELPFCLGVEWHPEYMATDDDRKIMAAFVAAAL